MRLVGAQKIIDIIRGKESLPAYFRWNLRRSEVKKPQIILKVDGGLGSQLHSYLLGTFLSKHFETEVKYDLNWFKTNGKSCDGQNNRNFDLLKAFPSLNFNIASDEKIKIYKKYYYFKNENYFTFIWDEFKKKPPLYLDGYYQHWKYYCPLTDTRNDRPQFSIQLSATNEKYLKSIQECTNSVAVHVRRGDYSVFDSLNICDEEYFISSIRKMKALINDTQIKFFFFSNGFDWVEKSLLPHLTNTNIQLVRCNDNDDGYLDFFLITQCKHQISSNSSFGYLGGILNPNPEKKVIIPRRWDRSMDEESEKAFHFPGFILN
jgi:hypothetical protein